MRVVRDEAATIDVSAARHVPKLPWVETNDAMIADLAVDHLLERGFRELAFCGAYPFNWSQYREERFIERVRDAGASCHVFHSWNQFEREYSWNRERKRLMKWLENLPIPVGIMAAYDIKGQHVLDACRELGLAVPEQVAVIGVDNDRHLCNLCTPPLSSIIPDTKRTGYDAAQLLHELMTGGRVPAKAHLVDPLGIAERLSTDILAIDDNNVSAALRFIRLHAMEGIRVDDVLRAVPLSRRTLESRFLKYIGRTPHQEIERLRMQRVKQLLRETDLPLHEIAKRTGFRHADYLTVAFKRHTGQQTGVFRRGGSEE